MEKLRAQLNNDIELLKNGTAPQQAEAEQHLLAFIALVLD